MQLLTVTNTFSKRVNAAEEPIIIIVNACKYLSNALDPHIEYRTRQLRTVHSCKLSYYS